MVYEVYDFQLDLFQLTPSEFRARYARGLQNYNDENIHMMRAASLKPNTLLAVGLVTASNETVGLSLAGAIVTHIVLIPSWSSTDTKSVTVVTVPFSWSPNVSATIYVCGGKETRIDGNFNLIENGSIGGLDACTVLFYGYMPATV